MMRCAALLLLIASLLAEDMPSWVLPGILAVESRSHYRSDGSIRYVDQRRGAAGERSAFQITAGAFRQVRRPGEQFWRIEVDQRFAQEIATRYLVWLRARSASWDEAVMAYNAGPGNRAPLYLARVRAAGGAK